MLDFLENSGVFMSLMIVGYYISIGFCLYSILYIQPINIYKSVDFSNPTDINTVMK